MKVTKVQTSPLRQVVRKLSNNSRSVKIANVQEAKTYGNYSVVSSENTRIYKQRKLTLKKTILR